MHSHGGGESLDAETRLLEREGKGMGAGCQPAPHRVGCQAGKRSIWLWAINTARTYYQVKAGLNAAVKGSS